MITAWIVFGSLFAWAVAAHVIRHGTLPEDLGGFRITHRSDNWQLLLFLYAVSAAAAFVAAIAITIRGFMA